MNIGIIGCGYVGLTVATVLAQQYKIGIWDIDLEKIRNITAGIVPFKDSSLETIFKTIYSKFETYENKIDFIQANDVFFLALPTDYNSSRNGLDTDLLENTIEEILFVRKRDINTKIIIKSTIPIGFTDRMRVKFKYNGIFFFPEFLREGQAYYDLIHPQRIIIGGEYTEIHFIVDRFVDIISSITNENFDVDYVTTSEAESIKLFSNAYLAMRVAFFNEIDALAEKMDMNSASIIKGVCKDIRIGNYYNNPSFGYGGYCLPKDTKELKRFMAEDGTLIHAIDASNEKRKKQIVQKFTGLGKKIGIYRMTMKYGSDNIRGSAIYDIVKQLIENNVEIIIYEPIFNVTWKNKNNVHVVDTLEQLAETSDVIIANRMYEELKPYSEKVYTRDLFKRD